MSRRMTIVFDDEELYTRLKVSAARTHRPAKDIVAEALCAYFETTADPDSEHGSSVARRSAGPDNTVAAVLRDLGLAKEASGSAR
jgi:plasmid stability protein